MNDEQRNRAIEADVYAEYALSARDEARENDRDSELLERLDAQAHQNAERAEKLADEAEERWGTTSTIHKHIREAADIALDAASETSWIYEQSYE